LALPEPSLDPALDPALAAPEPTAEPLPLPAPPSFFEPHAITSPTSATTRSFTQRE